MELDQSKCVICLKQDDYPIFYGDILKKSNIAAHYYCLLFSCDLPQNGTDSGGLLGFLLCDIKKYANNIKNKKCVYCCKENASIKCNKCNVEFHFICGIQNKCHYQFTGSFKSFCHLHIQILYKEKHPDNQCCEICLQAMGEFHPVLSISPKCCENRWFHRLCLMKYSLSAGYYIKCFWCQNKDFREQIRLEGIFVPDRDASWEKQPQAYLDLHRPYRKCCAADCLSPKGAEFFAYSGIWSLKLCGFCGASALHLGCFKSSNKSILNEYICDDCQLIRTSRTLITDNLNFSKNISEELDCDKSLYLVKTFNAEAAEICNIETDEILYNNVFDNFKINSQAEIIKNKSDDVRLNLTQNPKIINKSFNQTNTKNSDMLNVNSFNNQNIGFPKSDKQSNAEQQNIFLGSDRLEKNSNLQTLHFENEDLHGKIVCYIKNPIEAKETFALDEIIPVMAEFSASSDMSSDSDSEEIEDKELFLSIVAEELKTERTSLENFHSAKREKKNGVNIISKEKQLIRTEKYENINGIISFEIHEENELNKDNLKFNNIYIKRLKLFESQFKSVDELSESDIKLFEYISECELQKLKQTNKPP